MNRLNLAENIVRLRHERKITQEQLAEFIGVTKASVSKWETRQSTPDITILPQLASFFGVTLDELVGYNPQLSREQIQKLYQEFAEMFARCPFEAVMSKTEEYVKEYYSCYPFLFQICILWINHYAMADSRERQNEVLQAISGLCGHIRSKAEDIRICNDAIGLQALVCLRMGKTREVIEMLEEILAPDSLGNQVGTILTQAYLAGGDMEKADSFTQISIYNSLLSLVSNAVCYCQVHLDCLEVCEQTIQRVEKVEEAYGLSKLHPNLAAGFEYQAAMCFAFHKEKEKALRHIKKYVDCLKELLSEDEILLHGDDYFNRVEEWFRKTDSGVKAPRSRKLVLEDAKQTLENPVFSVLEGEQDYERLKIWLKEWT